MNDLRSRIGVLLDALEDSELKLMVEDSLNATKLKWAFYTPLPCSKCGHQAKGQKVQVDYPDLDKRAKFLSTFLDQAKGRPKETHEIIVDVPLGKRYEEMTSEQLEAIAEGRARELPA